VSQIWNRGFENGDLVFGLCVLKFGVWGLQFEVWGLGFAEGLGFEGGEGLRGWVTCALMTLESTLMLRGFSGIGVWGLGFGVCGLRFAGSPACGEFNSDGAFAFKVEPLEEGGGGAGELVGARKGIALQELFLRVWLRLIRCGAMHALRLVSLARAHSLRVKRERRFDLPTPLSPIRTTCAENWTYKWIWFHAMDFDADQRGTKLSEQIARPIFTLNR